MFRAPVADAHFVLNTNIRVIHVEHVSGGVRIYMRLPMPIVVADLVGESGPEGSLPAPAPYTTNALEDEEVMHYLDVTALQADPEGLGRLVVDGHGLFLEDGRLPGVVERVRAFPASEQTRFSTLEEVKDSMAGGPYESADTSVYVGEVIVDVQSFHAYDGPIGHYWFASRLTPDLKGLDQLANLLFDHAGAEARTFRAVGTLAQPLEVTLDGDSLAAAEQARQTWAQSVVRFVWQGMLHIWEGLDHVLFVLCLAIGATGLVNLLWRVTGFTLGHTITLIAGFFGYVPAGAWFIPTIEAAIALSIIYAGAAALLRRAAAATFVVTALFGILHGFGFSFVLHRILQFDAPHLWTSLISFNVGVEIGQIAIILLVYPLLRFTEHRSAQTARIGRAVIAVPAIAIAVYWTAERLLLVWTEIV